MVDDKRTESLEIDLSEAELRRVIRVVEEQGRSLEDWVRDVLLEAVESGWDDPDEE